MNPSQIMDMIGDPNIALVLVGNKSDLQSEREVSKEQVCRKYLDDGNKIENEVKNYLR
jgi:hypothetical protein